MNDLKTAERSLMGQQTLKNLMLWLIMGYEMKEDGTRSDNEEAPLPRRARHGHPQGVPRHG